MGTDAAATVPLDFAQIPAGQFEMGDHNGYDDPKHPSDELPLHTVSIDAFAIGRMEVTYAQWAAFLQQSFAAGSLEVVDGQVVAKGGAQVLAETAQSDPEISMGWDGNVFAVVPGRDNHPAGGVHWLGAAAYCNWMSASRGLASCYNLASGGSELSKPCFRLPTEAEWEYAGRGGLYAPYSAYPWGDEVDLTRFNAINSGDPWEQAPGAKTTPVGFYDGSLRMKADYGWPGAQDSYQTGNGINGFGLADMAGNVWEWVHDWYGKDYYASSPSANPAGPEQGDPMPDGLPYHGLRGGSFFNSTKYDGDHERVSNRDPGYFRGPGDPNGPWFHIGFRVALDLDGLQGKN